MFNQYCPMSSCPCGGPSEEDKKVVCDALATLSEQLPKAENAELVLLPQRQNTDDCTCCVWYERVAGMIKKACETGNTVYAAKLLFHFQVQ